MPDYLEIPLVSGPQSFAIRLSGLDYQFRIAYRNVAEGGYFLDIADGSGTPLVQGIPLVTGVDLLEQYHSLGFTGRMWVQTASNPDLCPSFDGLGSDSILLWVTGDQVPDINRIPYVFQPTTPPVATSSVTWGGAAVVFGSDAVIFGAL